MVRFSALTFFFVSLVAIIGLSLFMEFQNTALMITAPDCSRFAFEHDVLLQNIFLRAQGQDGYAREYDSRMNPCTGQLEAGIYETLVQQPPLENYGRFAWASGAVYGYQGAETPNYGNILYWYCPDNDRARVILADTEACNSFDGSYVFDDGALPRPWL